MALKRTIPEEYMDYDYGFTGVSEEEYRKKETEADLKVSAAEKDAAQKLREASLKINKAEAAKDKMEAAYKDKLHEVEKLEKFQSSIDFIDALRKFHPLSEKLYSWRSYRSKNWEISDRGRRLDHIWITPKLNKKLIKASIEKEVRGWDRPSDHSPLIADFKL